MTTMEDTDQVIGFLNPKQTKLTEIDAVSNILAHQYEAGEVFSHALAAAVNQQKTRTETDRPGALRIGIGYCLLGRYAEAIDWLGQGTEGKDKRYYLATALVHTGQPDKAPAEYERAENKGFDALACRLGIVEAERSAGNFSSAQKGLDRLGAKSNENAEFHYQQGRLCEDQKEIDEAIQSYENAVVLDTVHSGAHFRLGFLYDLWGEEDKAISNYVACLRGAPVYLNALMNLSVLYEDAGQFGRAAELLKRVLAIRPNHPRARLFLADVESSQSMLVDEEQERRRDQKAKELDTPMSEFELSVRARNCLKQMNIHTLGDLVHITETDLMEYKNFGESSLDEIKEILNHRDLQLDQTAQKSEPSTEPAPKTPKPGVLETLVADIELSVRSRKCLESLGMEKVKDLTEKTEVELLACKNFGQTSLAEIQQRLADLGLELTKSEEDEGEGEEVDVEVDAEVDEGQEEDPASPSKEE